MRDRGASSAATNSFPGGGDINGVFPGQGATNSTFPGGTGVKHHGARGGH